MVLGVPTFTFIHLLISLVGIGSGQVVVYGLLTSKRLDAWTILFLVTTVATSVTGFLFPFHGFTPAIGVGILSMLALVAAILALYVFRLAGAWRVIYVAGAVIALYFNVFVLIVQASQKIAVLRDMAPTQTEPPFLIAQVAALLFFIAVGIGAVRRFYPPNPA
jgi:hypothetical protein